MKKALGLVLAVSMALSLAACGGSATTSSPANSTAENTTTSSGGKTSAADGKVIKMALANPNPVGDVKDLASIKFADLAKEKSNGRIDITVYSGGQLGDSRDTIEGLKLGTNEIVIESIGTLDAYTTLANIDGVPYLYRDYDHYSKVMFGDIGKEIKETVGKEGGFKLLGGMYRGARECTSKKKFTTPEELKGLKIRVPNQQIYIDTWQTLGASPTPLALTETFTALQQNTVEAQENATIESYGFGFYDVCPYLIKTNHVYSTDVFIFDRDYFNNLPKDIQKILEESANEASEYRNEISLDKEAEFEQKFKDKGVEVVDIDTKPFAKLFDGFVDSHFPELSDWANEIAAVK
ncbi:MAG: DctP family TRAP transporter solute-binding subunit [Clostridia bacterium]|jgi:tripartite ATP-independent transporter DctP family solute receptor|nr:DctP family TRAP transporter solute-binding subunit [Clostridia bacterium]MCI2001250.1 DctP family TRAP transporter solute-binding subunit [Clostridia bacterium]MCI2015944.1 DctP family TRAP transporter solute-binding subunit [Clostridia bacterium]